MSVSSFSDNEVSRVFCRSDLGRGAERFEITADSTECAAVASRLDLVELRSLRAQLDISPWRGSGFAVAGVLDAVVVQCCVVTLEDFETVVHEKVAARYTDTATPEWDEQSETELVVDPLDDDEPEFLVRGCADLGELVVEHLATALDPYPRKPGSEFGELQDQFKDPENGDGHASANPFAVLRHLKTARSDKED